eukprot:scaffold3276_cov168-Amphora_coffeaeformis.AAC.7
MGLGAFVPQPRYRADIIKFCRVSERLETYLEAPDLPTPTPLLRQQTSLNSKQAAAAFFRGFAVESKTTKDKTNPVMLHGMACMVYGLSESYPSSCRLSCTGHPMTANETIRRLSIV